MTKEEDQLREKRFSRIRRVKKLLRPLPRRANIHRYPVLNWFAGTARKKDFLWSFRRNAVVPAFYVGWVLTLLPLYGLQLVLAFLLALGFRANLMIMIALQMVSNPITVLPLWYLNYQVGNFFLNLIFGESPIRFGVLISEASDQNFSFRQTLDFIIERTRESGSSVVSELLGRLVGGTFLGGLILGLLAGFISCCIYRIVLNRYVPSYNKVAAEALRRDRNSGRNDS
ncbi:DUF2062 domain-containing protein [Puniceicoccus vermicola]|uniref:DUF2062 domain-containing protein n=1 Tax=Puniceicoccus vermicola TaxID=388746 RepID=A0A7X1AUW4_9BACT|nr:DUF2062 domain-containing protein [Puniceicoccus vermicola]MBC2600372.1 DUF2062 domain-containing protein [Puniceicoccus vermicola]